ncbi:MAG: RNA methyltransferase [Clostridia bacterium]|nr:RNA methyltransferase [Clostridia bacterium]
MQTLITAKANEKIKAAVRLRDSAKARREEGLFFLEGARLCADASANVDIVRFFYTAKAAEKYFDEVSLLRQKAAESGEVSEDIAAKLSDTFSPQGIFCVCKTLDKKHYIDKIYSNAKIIALENIQDPSNLGAIARTAEALGIGGAVLCGCCDIYNPKAQRAAMGSLLRLPIVTVDSMSEAMKDFESKGYVTLSSTPSESACDITKTDIGSKTVCVIGNEGNGVTQVTAESCMYRVRVPMKGRAESLNASMAAAIIMWELMR